MPAPNCAPGRGIPTSNHRPFNFPHPESCTRWTRQPTARQVGSKGRVATCHVPNSGENSLLSDSDRRAFHLNLTKPTSWVFTRPDSEGLLTPKRKLENFAWPIRKEDLWWSRPLEADVEGSSKPGNHFSSARWSLAWGIIAEELDVQFPPCQERNPPDSDGVAAVQLQHLFGKT